MFDTITCSGGLNMSYRIWSMYRYLIYRSNVQFSVAVVFFFGIQCVCVNFGGLPQTIWYYYCYKCCVYSYTGRFRLKINRSKVVVYIMYYVYFKIRPPQLSNWLIGVFFQGLAAATQHDAPLRTFVVFIKTMCGS